MACASTSNIEEIPIAQNKILRYIVDAPWYVSSLTIYKDMRNSGKPHHQTKTQEKLAKGSYLTNLILAYEYNYS